MSEGVVYQRKRVYNFTLTCDPETNPYAFVKVGVSTFYHLPDFQLARMITNVVNIIARDFRLTGIIDVEVSADTMSGTCMTFSMGTTYPECKLHEWLKWEYVTLSPALPIEYRSAKFSVLPVGKCAPKRKGREQ